MTLCACGCSRSASSPRSAYATNRCRWRTMKRRERAIAAAGSSDREIVTCTVCWRELVRDARTHSKRYHDECKPTAQKLLLDAREVRKESS